MAILTITNYIDDEREIHHFSSISAALLYVKSEFFMATSEYYQTEVDAVGFDELKQYDWHDKFLEYGLPATATVQDFCNAEFVKFCKNKKFVWNDGRYDLFGIKLA